MEEKKKLLLELADELSSMEHRSAIALLETNPTKTAINERIKDLRAKLKRESWVRT